MLVEHREQVLDQLVQARDESRVLGDLWASATLECHQEPELQRQLDRPEAQPPRASQSLTPNRVDTRRGVGALAQARLDIAERGGDLEGNPDRGERERAVEVGLRRGLVTKRDVRVQPRVCENVVLRVLAA